MSRAAAFLEFTVLAGTPTLGAALKRRRLRLICIVIRAFSFESTAHWDIMACLLRTLNCAYTGSAAPPPPLLHLHIQTAQRKVSYSC